MRIPTTRRLAAGHGRHRAVREPASSPSPAGRPRSRSPLAYALPAVALVGILAPTAAFTGLNKTVTLTVDGHARSVRTFAGDVAGVLDRAGVTVGRHDSVTPGRSASVHDGSAIVVHRGRKLRLTVDGDTSTAWVTARHVSGALHQLDVTNSAYVSASDTRAIPRSGLALTIRLPQRVRVVAGGHSRTVTTTAPTVARMLANRHVAVDGNDLVSVPQSAYPQTGTTVRVVDVVVHTRHRRVAVPFKTVTHKTSSRYRGQSGAVQHGQRGTRLVTRKVTFHDGKKVAAKTVAKRVVKQPRPKIVEVGTKTLPAPRPAPAAAPRPAPAAPAHHSSASSGLNWAAVARCESGGNPRAVSPGGRYRGLYQFSLSTWHSVGGSDDPINASPSEQTHRAQLLYARTGASSWPVCGHNL